MPRERLPQLRQFLVISKDPVDPVFKTLDRILHRLVRIRIVPSSEAFGMHPVQFGLILVYNLCIGNITPPVGNTLFVAIKVGKTSLSEVMPYMLWYYGAILSGLLLVTFVPAVSLGLPWLTGVLK